MRAERFAVPLGSYLFVCLGLPLLNGAGAREGFWPHAGSVALIAGATALVLGMLWRLAGPKD